MLQRSQLCAVEVLHSLSLGLVHQELIEVGAKPVRVGNLVSRARRDEELIAPLGISSKGVTRFVAVEAEPAFQAASDLRICGLPRSPRRQRPDARNVIAVRELFEKKVGER